MTANLRFEVAWQESRLRNKTVVRSAEGWGSSGEELLGVAAAMMEPKEAAPGGGWEPGED